ncbi:hypothetical protein ML056_003467 [Klebsiella variicola]|uniref:hypothetical protein n=1 Tax=Klebsiella TaxID=570 RepID=UPI001C22AA68|nr:MULTISPECIES: hypothetical protein [Klebsiella]EIY5055155.1 hypothetical protein [Klebsiella variicola]MCD9775851.1 hypothetical protein [Klebsiella variicola subsp. variicola]QXA73935.1 hypothetical protein I6L71_23425 [Klebsiella aerogenes]HCI6019556.1 hypothetical protein [Klebsiella quasipneumoniae subsp. quasipneumoniae]
MPKLHQPAFVRVFLFLALEIYPMDFDIDKLADLDFEAAQQRANEAMAERDEEASKIPVTSKCESGACEI